MYTTMRATIDPGEFAHSAEGVDRAEELAGYIFEHLINVADVSRVDTTITSLFLLVEVLAGLEVYGDVSATDAVAQVQHLTTVRVAALRAAGTDADADADVEADVDPETVLSRVPSPHPGRLH